MALVRQFFEAALSLSDEAHDVFIVPSCRSHSSHTEVKKVLQKITQRDDLHIHYRECPKRGPRNSMENVFAVHGKKWPGQRGGQRKIYKSTTLDSNVL